MLSSGTRGPARGSGLVGFQARYRGSLALARSLVAVHARGILASLINFWHVCVCGVVESESWTGGVAASGTNGQGFREVKI